MVTHNKKNVKEPKKNISSGEPLRVKMNCSHYRRGCNILCKECNKFYPCRVCHDEMEDHKINQFEIDNIECRSCFKKQSCM